MINDRPIRDFVEPPRVKFTREIQIFFEDFHQLSMEFCPRIRFIPKQSKLKVTLAKVEKFQSFVDAFKQNWFLLAESYQFLCISL